MATRFFHSCSFDEIFKALTTFRFDCSCGQLCEPFATAAFDGKQHRPSTVFVAFHLTSGRIGGGPKAQRILTANRYDPSRLPTPSAVNNPSLSRVMTGLCTGLFGFTTTKRLTASHGGSNQAEKLSPISSSISETSDMMIDVLNARSYSGAWDLWTICRCCLNI